MIFQRQMNALLTSVMMFGCATFFETQVIASSALPVGPTPVTRITELVSLSADELPGLITVGFQRDLYVGFPFLNQVRRYSLKGELLSTTELPVTSGATTTGVAVKWNNHVYAAVSTYYAENDNGGNGIWEITDKGKVRKFVDLSLEGFPSHVIIDKSDHLFVSDSLLGVVWRIDRKGNKEVWSNDPQLQGDPATPFGDRPIGGTGLALGKKNKNLFVINTDYGKIIRLKIKRKGASGRTTLIVQDERLRGVDSISFNRRGILYAPNPTTNTVYSITKHGVISEVYTGLPLEFPVGISMKKQKGINLGFITNLAVIDRINPGIFRMNVASDPYHSD